MKTIMILANSESGLYDFRKEVLQRFVQEGFRVTISLPAGNYRERIEALGCEVIPAIIDRRGMNPVHDAKLFLYYVRLLKKIKPDVVLTYTIKPNTYGCMACRLCGIPYLVNITGLGIAFENPGKLQKVITVLYKIALKKAICVFFQNEYNRDFVKKRGCIHGRTRMLPGSGVSLTDHPYAPYPEEENEIRILNVTRIMTAKGIGELLEAAPVIKAEYPNVVFEIAGSYEEDCRGLYESGIKDLQEKGILRYYGYREDAQEIMNKCHIFMNPSYSEGMSNVLLEAAATGRPVIATRVPGCQETFQDGITGIGCEPKSSSSLIAALRLVLSKTAEERARMGQAGRDYVAERFDRQKVVAIYLEEIQNVF
ncbi:MAG: glycosyltransferase family 4 protein [Lachnospiraceae bacterium]|nr:glycosyltransferase family 4 protein [Lachnospiraceae bacterium]